MLRFAAGAYSSFPLALIRDDIVDVQYASIAPTTVIHTIERIMAYAIAEVVVKVESCDLGQSDLLLDLVGMADRDRGGFDIDFLIVAAQVDEVAVFILPSGHESGGAVQGFKIGRIVFSIQFYQIKCRKETAPLLAAIPPQTIVSKQFVQVRWTEFSTIDADEGAGDRAGRFADLNFILWYAIFETELCPGGVLAFLR